MKIGEIVKDSIRYPFSHWKSFLILGIITTLAASRSISQLFGLNTGLALFLGMLGMFGLLFGILIEGYEIRILKSSQAGFTELPDFDDWFDMIINGIKAILVRIIYFIPLFLIIVVSAISLGLSSGFLRFNTLTTFLVVLSMVVLLYFLIVYPILLMALSNMAFYGKLESAFEFRQIINKISSIGWKNFILWYIVTGIICLIIIFIGALIEALFVLIQLKIVGVLLVSLIVIPYLIIYLFRSTALFYLSDDPGFLECQNCGGYYQLQAGESPEDFEKCQCGGTLKHTTHMPSDTQSEGSNFDVRSFIKRKKTLILVGVLALIIIAIPVILLQNTPHNFVTTEKTLIGSYDASQLDSSSTLGTFVAIPPGTTKTTVEYNLSWTPAFAGVNGMIITGYNTNVTSHWGAPDNRNIIYTEGVTFHDNDQADKNGILTIDNSAIKSIVISGNGVKGTVNVYAYKTKLAV
ncbi:DUF4013 domain-containing protein [Methanobacterium formicicum]|nr:DUF4013 domain-containing protein [Methanobacterium formicicum]